MIDFNYHSLEKEYSEKLDHKQIDERYFIKMNPT